MLREEKINKTDDQLLLNINMNFTISFLSGWLY